MGRGRLLNEVLIMKCHASIILQGNLATRSDHYEENMEKERKHDLTYTSAPGSFRRSAVGRRKHGERKK